MCRAADRRKERHAGPWVSHHLRAALWPHVNGPEDDDGNAAAAAAPKNIVGEALGDTWRDHVLDGLPENATPEQKAEAFAKAICEDFKDKGLRALDNRWHRHKAMIEEFQKRFPPLAEMVIDAFENRKNELEQVAKEASGFIGVG
jgi:hypothetical protein